MLVRVYRPEPMIKLCQRTHRRRPKNIDWDYNLDGRYPERYTKWDRKYLWKKFRRTLEKLDKKEINDNSDLNY